MIQSLSGKYRKHVAWPMLVLFYVQILGPLSVAAKEPVFRTAADAGSTSGYNRQVLMVNKQSLREAAGDIFVYAAPAIPEAAAGRKTAFKPAAPLKLDIGGPSSPEASSFKTVGSNNLVNLATGDFSYSIPLLDVGGYPVNLFYTGGITMEQEASWVGLGWNINPGTVSRNMRGIPDDFNGTDTLKQTQDLKPNRTWGGDLGIDLEYLGIKNPKIGINASLGFSYNNYLGPALEVGSRVSLSLSTSKNVEAEKSAPATLGLNFSLGAKLSSRSGLTFSPSLSANSTLSNMHVQGGVGLSTSYNSRTGIKDLNVHSEMSYYSAEKAAKYETQKDGTEKLVQAAQGSISTGTSIGSTSISFAKPSYMPALRMPMLNANYSGQLEFGAGFYGLKVGLSALGYYSESKVPDELKIMYKPLVGYIYSENAFNNKNAVMDFNRLNDAEVTPNTPIISAPQYNYDVFSIQGEGTGGSIRAYRGDLGFMRDNVTVSKEKNISAGIDVGVPFHIGVNWNVINTPTQVGGWDDQNNTLRQTMRFQSKALNSSFENVYFKNPGEASVANSEMITKLGGDNLVRFQLGGSNVIPRIESKLEQFNKKTNRVNGIPLSIAGNTSSRDKRTQVISMLTAGDARYVGLDTAIRNYTGTFDAGNNISFQNIQRVGGYRKAHHISEIDVLEQNGMRYVYGLPVYSIRQKDYTFTVGAVPANNNDNLVNYSSTEPYPNSEHMANKAKLDGYVQAQETPAYASSFLLTGLLSPDYVDVTGDGITEDDLGNAVKFDYTRSGDHTWRTPRNNGTDRTAHFNEGLRTEKKDNKASVSCGVREVWYLSAIESKSMVAIFKTSSRADAKGVMGDMDGRVNKSEDANKKLSQIDLYTKAELRAKGLANARPVKTVNFEYDYSLCKGSPDDTLSTAGKLTLKAVYFSYNGQPRNSRDRYVFNYGNLNSQKDNPSYAVSASDRWGTYKPVKDSTGADNNPAGLSNADFPFTTTDKSKNDIYAGAWSLKKILLPSGGQMEIQYEADDYAYVQDRRACNMFNIYGLGKTTSYTANNGMYNNGAPSEDNYYLYVKLPQPLTSTTLASQRQEIFARYLEGVSQPGQNKLVCKLQINMPKGLEPLTVYPEYDDYGLCPNSTNKDYIYIHLVAVDGKSPLARSAIGFLTENIPGQAFEGYDVEVDGIAAFIDLAGAMLSGLKNAFKNVDEQMRTASPPKGRTIDLARSFVRLANPAKLKYGGGMRVKSVRLKDNWNKMTGSYNSVYGQDYDYTTTEMINGAATTISSGVASYEPGVGSEENPFREIVSFSNKLPLASAQYGAIEMPMLEALYPSPSVVYSKVTVRSIHRNGTHGDSTVRSAIGKQVTEYYTARDYPCFSSYTPMDIKDYNKNPFFSFFYKEVINRRAITQGFLVETNDMHGKMKSQLSYSESDDKTPLTASFYSYKNTGKNGLNDKVDFIYNDEQGTVHQGNMGVDVELMTDVREFSVKSNGFNGQVQVDLFTFGPIVVPIPTFFPLKTYVENKYRAVTCTKLINYHAIEDSVIVMDKGSVISTKTLAYDAETGSPIVSKTLNEFNDPVYNVSYPAYWAYSSVGLAYKNIGTEFTGVTFNDGKITAGMSVPNQTLLESGDELYITNQGSGSPTCISPSSGNINKLWVLDKNKNTTALTVPVKDLVVIDSAGRLFTRAGVSFRIIRSGRRNNLGLTVGSATTMYNPILAGGGKLAINNTANVVAASAMEYKEKWQVDADAMKRYVDYANPSTCVVTPKEDCAGTLAKNINPYLKGLIGNLKPYRTYVYYGNRAETTATSTPVIRKNGYLANFSYYWSFNNYSNLVPDLSNTKWVWNSELTRVNAKGQELETKDPLNRYTAMQYGFAKNLPVSMSQNAKYGESFAEGFEDDTYKERINPGGGLDCLNARYVAFGNTTNSYIVPEDKPIASITYGSPTSCLISFVQSSGYNGQIYAGPNGFVVENISNLALMQDIFAVGNRVQITDNVGPNSQTITVVSNQVIGGGVPYSLKVITAEGSFSVSNYTSATVVKITTNYGTPIKAHSGKNVLEIKPGLTGVMPLKLADGIADAGYNLNNFSVDSSGDYIAGSSGGVIAYLSKSGFTDFYPTNLTTSQVGGVQWLPTPYMSTCTQLSNYSYNYYLQNYVYFEVPKDGKYYFYQRAAGAQLNYPYTNPDVISTSVVDAANNVVALTQIENTNTNGVKVRRYSGCFKKGIYKLYQTFYSAYSYSCTVSPYASYCACQGNGTLALVTDQFNFLEYDPAYYPQLIPSDTLHPMRFRASFTMNSNKCYFTTPIHGSDSMLNPVFSIPGGKKMQFSAWIREDCGTPCTKLDYTLSNIEVWANNTILPAAVNTVKRTGNIIEGWQKVEGEFTVPAGATNVELHFVNNNSVPLYVDDIRIHPFNANMKSYVYDQRTLRLSAELDENNYASFYEYDEEGQLVRVKKETFQGVKTIKETRSSKQKVITDLQ